MYMHVYGYKLPRSEDVQLVKYNCQINKNVCEMNEIIIDCQIIINHEIVTH